MINYIKSKSEKERAFLGILGCVILLLSGYFILNVVSVQEEPPLGNTFTIFIGSTLISIGVLGIVLILKFLYDYNKKKKKREARRKKHKLYFLKKEKDKL
jgi:heme/copper-type cytochrome/quinol oxidase subunit 2